MASWCMKWSRFLQRSKATNRDILGGLEVNGKEALATSEVGADKWGGLKEKRGKGIRAAEWLTDGREPSL